MNVFNFVDFHVYLLALYKGHVTGCFHQVESIEIFSLPSISYSLICIIFGVKSTHSLLCFDCLHFHFLIKVVSEYHGFQQQYVAASTSSFHWQELQPMEHSNEGVVPVSRTLGYRQKRSCRPTNVANLTPHHLQELKENRKDKKALFFIYQAADEVIFERISMVTSAKEA